jgi:hypothetical protein
MDSGDWIRSHLPFMKSVADSRDTISVGAYIYGQTPPIWLGEIKNPENAYVHLKLRFRADSSEGNPNVFQTASINRGMRMEISGSTAAIIVPDLTVPGDLKAFTLTTTFKTGQWYTLEVEALNGAYIHATLDGHLVADYAGLGLSMETSQILVGGGFDASRAFRGQIDNISITKGNIAHLSPEKLPTDNREIVNAAPYIHGQTSPVSLGEIKTPDNAYIHLRLRFRADSTEGNPNVFQTAPINRGMRMEITGSTAAIIVPDLSVPSGLKRFTLTTTLKTGQWYTLEVGALNGSFVHATLDGHLVADYASPDLSMETSQLLVGVGFDASRTFRGQIENISVIKGSTPLLPHKSKRIQNTFYSVLLIGLLIFFVKGFLEKEKFVTYSVIHHRCSVYIGIVILPIVAGFFYYIYYLMVNRYLPSPFVWSKSETFMDLFNTLHWAYDDGRYTEWDSIYPPLSFLILRLINFVFAGGDNVTAALMRENSPFVIAGFFLIYLTVPSVVLKTKLWQGLLTSEKILIYFAIILSTPMLFALERGNLIVLCPVLLALVLSRIGIVRCLCIGLLINIKPYFALLMIYYIARKNWKGFTTSVVLSGLIFVVPGFFLDNHYLNFFDNLLGFAQSNVIFSFKEVMALPTSISAFSYVLKNPEGASIASGFLTTGLSSIMAYIIEAVKWTVIAISLVTLFTRSMVMRDSEIFTLLVVAITNLGIWVGGYSIIFYIVLIPVLIKLRANWLYIGLLWVIAMPLDIIPVTTSYIGQQVSYLSNSYVDVQWSLGLGSVVRPVANFALLLMLSREFLARKHKITAVMLFICKFSSATKETFPRIFAISTFYIGISSVLLAILLYNSIYFNTYFPITEGWFSAYAHLIRQGLIPYRDFYLFLTPLYPLLLAGFQTVFGESFIALRILGIFVVLLLTLFLYLILVRRFSPLVSTIATVTAIIYYQSGVAHITYDFIQFFTLFVLTATYLIIRYSDKESIDKLGINQNEAPLLFVAGIMVSLAFLTKQSNGTLVVVFSMMAVGLATAGQNFSYRLRNISVYMLGMALPVISMGIWLYFVSALTPFMEQVFFGAIASKGSIWHILFSWMGLANKDYLNQLITSLLYLSPLLVLSLIGTVLVKYRKSNSEDKAQTKDVCGIFLFFVLFCSVIVLSYYGSELFKPSTVAPGREFANYVIVVVSTALVAALMVTLIVLSLAGFSLRYRDLAVSATMAIGLVFGNGTSAGLSEVSAFLGFALALACLMSLPNVYGIVKVMVGVACLSFILFLSNAKFRQPYAWWNVSVPDVLESTTHPALPLLAGFWLSPDTTKVLEDITQLIQTHSHPGDDVFTFPNIPGFYVLANRWPHSKVVVSWFDFLPDIPAKSEAGRLLASPPTIIVNLKLPEEAWTAHERLFREGKPLGQRDISAAIWELTERRKLYQLDFAREISPGCILEVWHFRSSN